MFFPKGRFTCLNAMQDNDAHVGGEPSGHVLFGTEVCASDGLLTALQCLAILRDLNQKAHAITQLFPLMPFKQVNLPLGKNMTADINQLRLPHSSQHLIRKSGTEQVLRVYVWNSDAIALDFDFKYIADFLDK